MQIELHDQTRQAFLQSSDHRADCQLLKRGKIQTAAQGFNSVTSQMEKKNLRANIVGTQSRIKPRRTTGILCPSNLCFLIRTATQEHTLYAESFIYQ